MPRAHLRAFLPIVVGAAGLAVAWYVGGGGAGCTLGRKSHRARLDLDVIATAVVVYAMQQPQMRLPECSEFPQALLSPGPDGEPPLDPDRLTDGRFLDPWGNDYAYRKLRVLKFEVISFGRDGSPGGEGEDADVSKLVQLR